MKRIFLLFIVVILIQFTYAQNVGIGTTTPNSSAQLDVSSTSKGFLPPRLSILQRNAINNPAIGLVIFCTDCDELEVYNGTTWKSMIGTAACVNATLPSITICNQIWMNKNLAVARYKDGSLIPQVTDPAIWANLSIGAWCWYNNDSATYAATYGRLYNWYAVIDSRGLAPAGWHVPSYAEWLTLTTCLGGPPIAGGKIKSTTVWNLPNTGATNSSGFAGLPGGYRNYLGPFLDIGNFGYWWSSTPFGSPYAWYLTLNYFSAGANTNPSEVPNGFSVRCVRD